MSYKGKDRRTGFDRRETPEMQTCEVPCAAIDKKLDAIWICVKSKMSAKITMWLFGGLAFFCVIILGGMEWTMLREAAVFQNHLTEELQNIRVKTESVSIKLDFTNQKITGLKESVGKDMDKLEAKIEKFHKGD